MKMPHSLGSLLLTGAVAVLVSCGSEDARMAKGFHLPEGDIERGKAAFQELKCTLCHSVSGVEFPDATPGNALELGGKVRKIKTYGQLVTAVIDPGHEIAQGYASKLPAGEDGKQKSPMPPYNSDMTVRQLADIVTFLHSHYHKQGADFEDYPYVY